jgi:hypothetical protein
METWVNYKEELSLVAKTFDKTVKIYSKEDTLIGRIHDKFFPDFAFTLANYHFYPRNWSKKTLLRVLPHESRHTAQFRWAGLGIHPIIGFIPMMVLYVFFPIPIFFAVGRFFLELDADKACFDYLLTNNLATKQSILFRIKQRINSLTGKDYLYSVPKWFAKYFYNKISKNL